jgi:hypothetical protein
MRHCATCGSPHRKEVDRRLKSGETMVAIVRWLKEVGDPIGRNALARPHRDHLGLPRRASGPKPISSDLLVAIRDRTHEDLESGLLSPTLRDGISAVVQLDHRAEKAADADLMLMLAQLLGGGVVPFRAIEGEYRVVDEEAEEDLAYFRQLGEGGYVAPVARPVDTTKVAHSR